MNVVEEKIDDLNAILRVSVSPSDYSEKVEKTLNDYRKKANIPGFRPGKIPTAVVKKKYGRAILSEELNKLVNQSLNDFIRTNNLNVLGNPLPKTDEPIKGDFVNPQEFEFAFEIGLAPEFEVNLSKKNAFDFLKIDISEEMLDKEIENLARRYGSLVSAEKVGGKDMVLGTFSQIRGDITHTSTISVEYINDEAVKNQFVGQTIGTVVVVDPIKVSKGIDDLAAMLGVSKETAEALTGDFEFKITEIKTMIPAAVDQALFDKLFGEGQLNSEAELRAKISDDLTQMFQNDSDRVFSQKVTTELIENTKVDLPEEFLKKWILASSEKEITQAELDADFGNYTKSLKWQLIQNKLTKENGIKVDNAEVIDYTKQLLVNQYAQYGIPAPEDKDLEDRAKTVLQNKEEASKIFDNVFGIKMLHFFKETVQLKEKILPYEQFVEAAYGKK
jgi:trigger factor